MSEIAEEKKDWPNCVFYPDIKCSVRHEIQSASLEKYMKPLEKGSDEQQVVMKLAGAFKEMFANEWAVLHAFCHICPFKVRIDRAVLANTLEETIAIMKIVKEQLREEGVLPK